MSKENRQHRAMEKTLQALRENVARLETREGQFNVLLRNSSDLITILGADGTTVYQSPSLKRILGFEPEEKTGVSCFDFVIQDDLPRARSTFQQLLQKPSGSTITFEFRTMDARGQCRFLETIATNLLEDPMVRGIILNTRDVTERKLAEEAVQKEKQRFQILSENAPFGMMMIDQEGVFRYVNPKFRELLGYDLSDLPDGKTWFRKAFPDPDYRHHVISVWKEDFKIFRPAEKVPRVFTATCKDGTAKGINFISVQLESGEILLSCEDITERKKAEVERENLKAQLFQAQKMESIGRLAGGVAHDFNNMLGVIIGHAEMGLAKVESAEGIRHDLQEILKAATRSADLTRQLLAFARKQTIRPRVLDLNEIVSGMLNMLQRLIGENIHLIWMPGPGLWKVRIDPSQVDQILANLVVNARDAISGTGSITLKTENLVADHAYCARDRGFVPGAYILLTIEDSGSGMAGEVLEHLFEPFFTTKEMGKGTGLGLATVYGIVKQNNGFIYVESEPEKGSAFKIFLPRVDLGSVQNDKEPSGREPKGAIQGGTETIFLVEDDQAILDLSKTVLEGLGYKVVPARAPSQALNLIAKYEGEISLLITDVVMPEMNGRELTDRVVALKPGVKCLYMSGYPADGITQENILDEKVSFIQKPFQVETFAAAVRKILDRK